MWEKLVVDRPSRIHGWGASHAERLAVWDGERIFRFSSLWLRWPTRKKSSTSIAFIGLASRAPVPDRRPACVTVCVSSSPHLRDDVHLQRKRQRDDGRDQSKPFFAMVVEAVGKEPVHLQARETWRRLHDQPRCRARNLGWYAPRLLTAKVIVA
jgi:hypothetical protein